MIRTVYIAAVLGVMTFFLALALGISWGMVLEKDGWEALTPSAVWVIVGLAVGVLGFGLGLLLFRTKRRKAAVDMMDEVGEAIHENGKERAVANVANVAD